MTQTTQQKILAAAENLGWRDGTMVEGILHLIHGRPGSLRVVKVILVNERIRFAYVIRPDGTEQEVHCTDRDKLAWVLKWLSEVSRCNDCAAGTVRQAQR